MLSVTLVPSVAVVVSALLAVSSGCKGDWGLHRRTVVNYRSALKGIPPEVAATEHDINRLYGVNHNDGHIERQSQPGPLTRLKINFCDSYLGRDISRFGDLFQCGRVLERFGRERSAQRRPQVSLGQAKAPSFSPASSSSLNHHVHEPIISSQEDLTSVDTGTTTTGTATDPASLWTVVDTNHNDIVTQHHQQTVTTEDHHAHHHQNHHHHHQETPQHHHAAHHGEPHQHHKTALGTLQPQASFITDPSPQQPNIYIQSNTDIFNEGDFVPFIPNTESHELLLSPASTTALTYSSTTKAYNDLLPKKKLTYSTLESSQNFNSLPASQISFASTKTSAENVTPNAKRHVKKSYPVKKTPTKIPSEIEFDLDLKKSTNKVPLELDFDDFSAQAHHQEAAQHSTLAERKPWYATSPSDPQTTVKPVLPAPADPTQPLYGTFQETTSNTPDGQEYYQTITRTKKTYFTKTYNPPKRETPQNGIKISNKASPKFFSQTVSPKTVKSPSNANIHRSAKDMRDLAKAQHDSFEENIDYFKSTLGVESGSFDEIEPAATIDPLQPGHPKGNGNHGWAPISEERSDLDPIIKSTPSLGPRKRKVEQQQPAFRNFVGSAVDPINNSLGDVNGFQKELDSLYETFKSFDTSYIVNPTGSPGLAFIEPQIHVSSVSRRPWYRSQTYLAKDKQTTPPTTTKPWTKRDSKITKDYQQTAKDYQQQAKDYQQTAKDYQQTAKSSFGLKSSPVAQKTANLYPSSRQTLEKVSARSKNSIKVSPTPKLTGYSYKKVITPSGRVVSNYDTYHYSTPPSVH